MKANEEAVPDCRPERPPKNNDHLSESAGMLSQAAIAPPATVRKGRSKRRVPARGYGPVNAGLWGKVAPGATWRSCVQHGAVTRPDLRTKTISEAVQHVAALCPDCGCFLGFIAQLKTFRVASPEEKRAALSRFQSEAKAAGHSPGVAFYRFKGVFGHRPDPAWERAGMEVVMALPEDAA